MSRLTPGFFDGYLAFVPRPVMRVAFGWRRSGDSGAQK